ncbi:hypothetical protein [Terrabacter sp. 2RAF25]|uniref:hypothetical protein n=1 Tax=Terrabacter sp. 2RAF25 TaxID=3232998 RepID=UPI003F9DC990
MKTRTKAKPAALLLLALVVALVVAVHGMPGVATGTSAAVPSTVPSTVPSAAVPSDAVPSVTAQPGASGRAVKPMAPSAEGGLTTSVGLGSAGAAVGLPFSVTGSVTGLAPGLWRPVAVTVHNPNGVAIRMTSLVLSVAADSTPPGCRTATNLEIQQVSMGSGRGITIPAGRSVVLAEQGATNPRIRLRNLPAVNQDVCKGKSFSLVWSGTATS